MLEQVWQSKKHLLAAALLAGGALFTSLPTHSQSSDARTLLNQAVEATALNNHKQAELLYRQVIELRQNQEGATDVDLLEVILNLALEVSALGRYEESKLLLQRADVALGDLKGSAIHARYLSALALDHGNRGDFETALGFIQQATRIRNLFLKSQRSASVLGGSGVQLPDLAQGLLIESRLHLAMGYPDRARVAADLARKVVVAVDGAPAWWLAKIEEIMARVEKEEKKYRVAENRLNRAIAINRQKFGETRPVANAWMALGDTQYESGSNANAVTSLRRGLDIIEANMKEGQSASPGQVLIFLNAAWKELQLRPDEADRLKAEMFAVSQLAREGQTARTIAGMVARLSAGDGEASTLIRTTQEKARLRDNLRLDMGREVSKPKEERSEERLLAMKAEYDALLVELEGLNADLRRVFPNYEQIVASGPVELVDIQANLQDGEALYVPVPGPNNSFAFLVTKTELRLKPMQESLSDIADDIATLRLAFEVSSAGIRDFDMALSHKIWLTLFGGLEAGLDGIDNVSLVPKGPLLSMPFGMLVTEPATGTAYHKAEFFAKRYASSLSPSIRSWLNFRRLDKQSAAAKSMIGFGNPVFDGDHDGLDALEDECRPDGQVPLEMVRALAPLPDTQTELETVSAILGEGNSDVFFSQAVEEEDVRATSLEDYKIVYFATHGLLPSELACQAEPALALTAPPAFTGQMNDGLLTSSEVLELQLDADLVVLSACNTGGGDGKFGGESLSGLARAFFYSGARSLLVSHWQVSSDDTATLMVDTFRQQGMTMAESLRQAQLAFIDNPEKAHPFFWAPFTLVGDGTKSLNLDQVTASL